MSTTETTTPAQRAGSTGAPPMRRGRRARHRRATTARCGALPPAGSAGRGPARRRPRAPVVAGGRPDQDRGRPRPPPVCSSGGTAGYAVGHSAGAGGSTRPVRPDGRVGTTGQGGFGGPARPAGSIRYDGPAGHDGSAARVRPVRRAGQAGAGQSDLSRPAQADLAQSPPAGRAEHRPPGGAHGRDGGDEPLPQRRTPTRAPTGPTPGRAQPARRAPARRARCGGSAPSAAARPRPTVARSRPASSRW